MMFGAWLNKIDWRRERVAMAMMAATWLAFFWRQIFLNKVYFEGDTAQLFYPLEFVYGLAQRSWRLPLWSPEFGFGHPLLAWGQLGFFNPLHLLLRAMMIDALDLIQISMVVHFGIGLLGMYWWLRRRRCLPLGAALGAITFVFCGYNVSHIVHVNFFVGVMLLPWLLISIDRLLERLSLRRAGLVAVVAAWIVISAHAQIALYCLIVAAVVSVWLVRAWSWRLAAYVMLAGGLGAMISALTWLPLLEFLPYNDRTEGMFREEMYNFSLPPWQAITLFLPTYFGSQGSYRGASSYQELGNYMGVIPILLAGAALAAWRSGWRRDKAAALALMTGGIILALGKYSIIYRIFIEHGWWPPFTAPSRWLLPFMLGAAWLAAAGMTIWLEEQTKKERWKMMAGGFGLLLILLVPFVGSRYLRERQSLDEGEVLWLAVGIVAFMIASWLGGAARVKKAWSVVIVGVAAGTLVWFGWQRYPLEDRNKVKDSAVLAGEISQYNEANIVPARLYSDKVLLRGQAVLEEAREQKRTDELARNFSVWQPMTAERDWLSCLTAAIESDRLGSDPVWLKIWDENREEVLREVVLRPPEITDAGRQQFCFKPIKESAGKNFWVSFTSPAEHGSVSLFYTRQPETAGGIYMVRMSEPSAAQFEQSQKAGRLVMGWQYGAEVNEEQALMMRHLNATAGASSARWIGSISIRRYRDFVKELFANDRDTVDGAGRHVLVKNRRVFDLAGVTHFAQRLEEGAEEGMTDHGFKVVAEVESRGVRFRLYENLQALPRAWLVGQGVFNEDRKQVFELMQRDDFDPLAVVYLESETRLRPSTSLGLRQGEASETGETGENGKTSKTSIVSYEPTRVEVETEAEQAMWLVVTDAYVPMWKVYVDEAPAPQYIAYQLFRAVRVPAGRHTITWRYESRAAAYAKGLTGIGFMILIIIFTANRFKMRNRVHERNQ